ncbi:MAG: HD domain-containing phosphohydrolase [Phaeospirillum sp.]|nr:HD domain-containing phosphohydrolase [Phaeospirillum sp.]
MRISATEKRGRRVTSVRGWLGGSLAILCTFLAGAAGFILYELDLRKHDYQILNLAGQMRVIAASLEQQANDVLSRGVLQGGSLDQNFGLFERATAERVDLYERIVIGFANRELPADLTGREEALTCNWDRPSTSQLDATVAQWRRYRTGLEAARGGDPLRPRTLAMAGYLLNNGPALVASTEDLAKAFQAMMEGKLRLVRLLIVGMLAGGALVTGVILILLSRAILRPLDRAVAGFTRVAAGDLGFQVEEANTAEFGRMTRAFNDLSLRLHGMFGLIEHIGRGCDLRETMDFIVHAFRRFVAVDGLVLLVAAPEGGRFKVESRHGEAVAHWPDLADPLLDQTVRDRQPLITGATAGPLAEAMRGGGVKTVLLLPMGSIRDGGAVLAVASMLDDAYTPEQRQFLGNMATQVDAVLSRTLAMDALVVAAVQGLAKLAESRDPETGDHLVRMSLYSAFIAEDLGRRAAYRDIIDPGYVRALHRFAPMHDIGKVGIADRVLLKPGRLDDEERREMNKHPLIGAEVLRLCEQRMNELGRSVFQIGIEIAESHHEKWDGSGYPNGLAGDAIPLSARIVAVADVFDALTSKRPYKDAFSVEKALDIIHMDVGTHFDAEVVEALDRVMPRVLDVYDRLKHV